jgi:hypothetical protein
VGKFKLLGEKVAGTPYLINFGSPITSYLSIRILLMISASLTFESSNVTVVVWAMGLASTDLTPGICETIILIAVDVPSHIQPGVLNSTILSAANAVWLLTNDASSAASTSSRNKLFFFMKASSPEFVTK